MRHTVSEEDARTRLDLFLAKVHPEASRAAWQRTIEEGRVTLNGMLARPSSRLSWGDQVAVSEPSGNGASAPEELPQLKVVYEDSATVVIDKQPGVVVHPSPGHASGTLVDALVARYPEIRGVPSPGRPGIVHRLDKDTSGLMVVARTHHALQELQHQMKARTIDKQYLLLAEGSVPDDRGLIDLPIDRDQLRRQRMAVQSQGKPARTYFTVLERLDGYSYIEAKPVSGRTHQIRVHFSFIGHPVAGDRLYGSGRGPNGLKRQFLHACRLSFDSPVDGERLTFQSPLPEELESCLEWLRNRRGGAT
ncbi:MAG TPA: RluA family pseudouridine synthase [Chloroflexota bacterium]|nr:RluA family pseudouridine synthase [Chloroflexota bacterium]